MEWQIHSNFNSTSWYWIGACHWFCCLGSWVAMLSSDVLFSHSKTDLNYHSFSLAISQSDCLPLFGRFFFVLMCILFIVSVPIQHLKQHLLHYFNHCLVWLLIVWSNLWKEWQINIKKCNLLLTNWNETTKEEEEEKKKNERKKKLKFSYRQPKINNPTN